MSFGEGRLYVVFRQFNFKIFSVAIFLLKRDGSLQLKNDEDLIKLFCKSIPLKIIWSGASLMSRFNIYVVVPSSVITNDI